MFSVGSVTVRPQILGRPTPGYTDEARRNQVEGSIKVSVLLKADGTVSDIKVARAASATASMRRPLKRPVSCDLWRHRGMAMQ